MLSLFIFQYHITSFTVSSKPECICYYFRHDHESSGFQNWLLINGFVEKVLIIPLFTTSFNKTSIVYCLCTIVLITVKA